MVHKTSVINAMKFLLLCISLLSFISFSESQENACDGGNVSIEAKLHRKLLCKYNRDVRPVKNYNSPVNVSVHIMVKHFVYSHQMSSIETITVTSYIIVQWKDEFLQWRPDEYGGLTKTLLDSSEIWNPDLAVWNSPGSARSLFYTPCSISNDGNVFCTPIVTHEALCNMSYKNWPDDRQNCTLRIGMWLHNGEEVNFDNVNVIISPDYVKNKFWKLISVGVLKDPGIFKCCPTFTYPKILFSLIIERYKSVLMMRILIPCLAMVSMTLISLWINVESFVRIAVMFFNVYCHFFFELSMEYWMPGSGDEIPNLLIYYKTTIVIAILVLLEGLILRNIVKYTIVTPLWVVKVTQLMNTDAGKIVFYKFEPTSEINIASDDTENLTLKSEKVASNVEWRKLASFINRTFSLIIILTYFISIVMYLI